MRACVCACARACVHCEHSNNDTIIKICFNSYSATSNYKLFVVLYSMSNLTFIMVIKIALKSIGIIIYLYRACYVTRNVIYRYAVLCSAQLYTILFA